MDMLCRMKKEREMTKCGSGKYHSPHRRSLEICRGKGRKWGSEPEISALMGANVELACPDREKHIAHFLLMIVNQRERNLARSTQVLARTSFII